MILVIRIAGQVNLSGDVKETLNRIHLHRKYSAVLLQESDDTSKLLMKIRNLVSFGKINTEMLAELLAKRGQPLGGKKIDAKKVMSEIDKKPLDKLGMKPFFRLHPPRKGIESKRHANETTHGVLGENLKINELLARML